MPAPAPAPAAPPAAPAPKPTAAPLPAPSRERPVIAPPPEADPADWMGEEALEIESMDDEKKPARPAPGAKPKPKPKAKVEPEPAPEPEPEEPKEEEPRQEDQTPPEEAELEEEGHDKEPELDKMPARDLREAYKKSKAKVQEVNARVAKLEAELQTFKKEGGEPSAIATQLKSLQEENQQLRGRLADGDYREHPEYQQKQTAFEGEFVRARRDLSQIPVENPDGSTRKFTDDDLIGLIGAPFGEDRKIANRLFGDAADDALQYARSLRKMADDQSTWVENYRKNSGKKALETEATMKATAIERSKAFESANNELAEKFPFWFKPKEGDDDGNRTLAAGQALTKLMFQAGNLTEEEIKLLPERFQNDIKSNGHLSKENGVRLHALIRSKAMNHDRIARWMKKLRLELKETKEALAQYEASEPDVDPGIRRRSSGGGGGVLDDDDAEIDRLSRQNR